MAFFNTGAKTHQSHRVPRLEPQAGHQQVERQDVERGLGKALHGGVAGGAPGLPERKCEGQDQGDIADQRGRPGLRPALGWKAGRSPPAGKW